MMKNTIAMLLVLLFVFSSKSSAIDETDPVLDSNGRNQTCPYDVFLERNHRLLLGIPMTFSPVDTKVGVIYELTDLYIKFMPREATGCPQSTVWKLDKYDESSGEWIVTTGGVEGGRPQALFSWFKTKVQ
ncbi:hypothetical protein CRYUN_Cryun18bG0122400 [Craigia yunnanensis]